MELRVEIEGDAACFEECLDEFNVSTKWVTNIHLSLP